MQTYDFTECTRLSDVDIRRIKRILLLRIPGCTEVVRANEAEDYKGTDFWAKRGDLPPLSIDVKARTKDHLASRGKDDLALETWSNIDSKLPGWTRDPNKRTDYILFYWRDTARFFILPFPPLCKVFTRYWEEWRETYQTEQQTTHGVRGDTWESECVFVPRTLVVNTITAWASGSVLD